LPRRTSLAEGRRDWKKSGKVEESVDDGMFYEMRLRLILGDDDDKRTSRIRKACGNI